jgi:hypothetical protein
LAKIAEIGNNHIDLKNFSNQNEDSYNDQKISKMLFPFKSFQLRQLGYTQLLNCNFIFNSFVNHCQQHNDFKSKYKKQLSITVNVTLGWHLVRMAPPESWNL